MDFIVVFKSIIYGMLIGTIQYLPISYVEGMAFNKLFNGMYQDNFYLLLRGAAIIGASTAMIIIFSDEVNLMTKGNKPSLIKLWKNIIIGSFPSLIVCLMLRNQASIIVNNEKFYYIGIIAAGIALIISESIYKRKKIHKGTISRFYRLPMSRVIILGIIQGVFLSFGISPILGGIVGCWIIAVDTRCALVYSLLSSLLVYIVKIGSSYFLLNNVVLSFESIFIIFLVTIVSFLISLLSLDTLASLRKKKSLRVFAFINLLVGIICLI